jgi:F420-non-reducing hydrogenase iron-sulfur subunit
MRLNYPPEVKVILVPCTGRVDILHLLKAFEGGADMVYVAGCLEGDCHYLSGNTKAAKRVAKLKKDFEQMGFEPERVEMYHLGAAHAQRFAAIAEELTEKAFKLGPSPLRPKAREAWLAAQPKASGQ